jgi:hypothetical protein
VALPNVGPGLVQAEKPLHGPRVLEMLEDHVDDLDEKLLTQDMEQDELLRQLVKLRRRTTELRRLLAPHREVLAILTQPDSRVFTSTVGGYRNHGLPGLGHAGDRRWI